MAGGLRRIQTYTTVPVAQLGFYPERLSIHLLLGMVSPPLGPPGRGRLPGWVRLAALETEVAGMDDPHPVGTFSAWRVAGRCRLDHGRQRVCRGRRLCGACKTFPAFCLCPYSGRLYVL